ncbi:uncharacterized protein LOC135714077 [Ochlerotatus camptorhynchus]|uniref:uncharacterized protein LOC135714077 n=1 Tax=Ochlerotatus camptorhynchus TaxID=644619 RepID=UPI0031D3C254
MEEPRSNNQALLSRRESLLAALGRAEAFLEAYDAARDARQVQIRLDHIENVWARLEDVQTELESIEQDEQEIQKFHYLKAAVKGEAAQLIETIAISAANYNLAWDTLVKRYANDYLLKKRHLQALFDIQRMKKETSSTLHALVDEFERHTKTLRQMGEPTGQWSSILEHLLCTRLHDDTLKAWEVHASTVENPDYPCLIDFLQRRVRVLESISVNHHAPPSVPSSSHHGAKRQQQFRLTSCASTTKVGVKCPVCSQEHYISRCQKFLGLSVAQRQQLSMKKRLCHNCLKGEHIAKNCSSDFNCKHCNRRHHSLLHAGTGDGTQGATSDAPVPSTSAVVQAHQNRPTSSMGNPIQSAVAAIENVPDCEVSVPIQHPKENVFLLTALVRVVDAFGQGHRVRALLDSGSQPDIVSERMARQLRLKKTNVDVTIQGAGQLEQSVRESIVAQVKSRNGNFEAEIKFLVMNKVTANLPAHDISTDDWQIPEELALADPGFNKSQRIDMVLGAKHFQSFFPSAVRIHLGEHRPLLVKSVFGWVVTGSALTQPNQSPTPYSLSYSILNVSTVTLEESIERFWKTEDLSMKDNYSVEERYCESLFKSTTTRTAEGRYMVRLPRKPEFEAMMGESQINAYRRYEMLERRFERSPTLKEDYHKFLKEYLSLGHMRLVESDNEGNSTAYYLPHHPVLKESSTTTKLRVVFDGSAKTSTGHSLNEALCVGPVVQDDLITILLRFRTFLVALVADIAKMYRQALVHPDDTHLQRILWRVSASTVIHVFELLTVTYGLAPSSFLATRVLQQLAIDEGDAFPLAGPALRKSFYVDDFIGGANSIEEAISLREQLEDLMQRGGFDLRKWTSSRFEVLQGLDKEHIGTQSTLCFTPNESIKALGIVWEPENDAFRFDSAIQPRDAPPTKRSILSDIAKLFDPLGLIAPVVVRAKILMQELWLLSSDWDEPVPDSIRIRWESICNEYPLISSFRAERYAFLPNSRVELHTFADASESAYGASFIAALRRFIARRGRPSHIHSDNGKNFEGAKGELTEMFEIFRKRNERETIVSTCAEEGIVWHFTPPKAPHFGGLWEAAVKVAKRHLFRQLGASRLSYEDMATVLCQIEAVMNSRPLLPMSDDPNDLAALTPAHFLIGTSMHALPDPDLLHITESRLEHYHKLQLHVQQFWIHWRKEYLQELQKDTKSAERNNSIQPGRMVVIVNEQQAPIRWPLARIVDLRPGTDQITRVVTLRTARGIITRPITKICLLPDVSAESGDGHRLPEEIDP